MVMLTFTWNTAFDDRTCARCKDLHGHTWYFYDETPTALIHSQHGPVWNLITDMSQAHGQYRRGGWHCRCRLTWEIDDSDLQDDLLTIRRQTRLLDDRLIATTQFLETFVSLLARGSS